MPQHLCRMGHGGIGNGIFHIIGAGLSVEVTGDVAVPFAEVLAALVQHHRGLAGGVGAFIVNSGNLFHNGIGHGNYAGVPHHAVRLAAHQVPYRELSLLVVYVQHSIHDIGPQLRVNHVVKRHCRAVSIPEGIGCV